MKFSNRLSLFSFGLLILITLIMFLSACSEQNPQEGQNKNVGVEATYDTLTNDAKYITFVNNMEAQSLDTLRVNMATFILRKPDAAQWDTKFDPIYRSYYINKMVDLELRYVFQKTDTLYYYVIRDGRDQNGKLNRGVGGRMVLNEQYQIQYLEELFVTRIKPRAVLENIGLQFMNDIEDTTPVENYTSEKKSDIEWPDGRLFYNIEKSEWRYVD